MDYNLFHYNQYVHFVSILSFVCMFRDQIKTSVLKTNFKLSLREVKDKTSVLKTNFKLSLREVKEGHSFQFTHLFHNILNS